MDDAGLTQLKKDYLVFRRSPVAADLILFLSEQFERALAEALDEPEPIKAVSRLQNASAYKTVMSYIDDMAAPTE